MTDEIPGNICDLNINWSNPTVSSLSDNYFCLQPYPECLEEYVGDQSCDWYIQGDSNLNGMVDILDVIQIIILILNENLCFTGITETDSDGNLIGNIDENDWCEFEFDMDATDSNFGLNPVYPNPVSPQEWGPFGNSYQICFQFSTPFDSTWSNFNAVDINIINASSDIIYTLYSDNYINGQVGACSYISDSLIVEDSIYRMIMQSDNYYCQGDIQFIQ